MAVDADDDDDANSDAGGLHTRRDDAKALAALAAGDAAAPTDETDRRLRIERS